MTAPQSPRFKPLGEGDMTDAQRKVHREIAGGNGSVPPLPP